MDTPRTVPYFFVATSTVLTARGPKVSCQYFRKLVREDSLPSRREAYTNFVGDSGAIVTFLYYERDEQPAGSYFVALTAQPPQHLRAGLAIEHGAEVRTFSEPFSISQVFYETRQRLRVGPDWEVMFWQVSPVTL